MNSKKLILIHNSVATIAVIIGTLGFVIAGNERLLLGMIILAIGTQISNTISEKREAKKALANTSFSKGPILNCENLSMTFGKNKVLKDVNITANPGELHCIIGPNGGGKSTLIKAVLGQLHHEGSVSLEWQNDAGTISYVPQIIEVDKTVPLTVEDFIWISITNHPPFFKLFLGMISIFLGFLSIKLGSRFFKSFNEYFSTQSLESNINDVLKRVNMLDKKKFLFSELSGGERQRVLFAQALIPSPQLLILDEPMNSIDRTGAEIFGAIIDDLKSQGVTILWVHHDLAEVREKADQVTCINREVIFQGKPSDVMDEKHLLEIFTAQPAVEAN